MQILCRCPLPGKPGYGAIRPLTRENAMIEGRPAQAARFTPRTRPVVPPIHQSVTYFLDDEAYKDVQDGGLDEIWYGRFRNPTVDVAAEEIRRLEGAEAAFMTASGMGAIATTLLSLVSAGGRVVA